MPPIVRCPHCGTLCRQVRGPAGSPLRLVPAATPLLARRLTRLEAALARVRRAVKADAKRLACSQCREPGGESDERS